MSTASPNRLVLRRPVRIRVLHALQVVTVLAAASVLVYVALQGDDDRAIVVLAAGLAVGAVGAGAVAMAAPLGHSTLTWEGDQLLITDSVVLRRARAIVVPAAEVTIEHLVAPRHPRTNECVLSVRPEPGNVAITFAGRRGLGDACRGRVFAFAVDCCWSRSPRRTRLPLRSSTYTALLIPVHPTQAQQVAAWAASGRRAVSRSPGGDPTS